MEEHLPWYATGRCTLRGSGISARLQVGRGRQVWATDQLGLSAAAAPRKIVPQVVACSLDA